MRGCLGLVFKGRMSRAWIKSTVRKSLVGWYSSRSNAVYARLLCVCFGFAVSRDGWDVTKGVLTACSILSFVPTESAGQPPTFSYLARLQSESELLHLLMAGRSTYWMSAHGARFEPTSHYEMLCDILSICNAMKKYATHWLADTSARVKSTRISSRI